MPCGPGGCWSAKRDGPARSAIRPTRKYGTSFPDHVADFCESVFADGGCLLCGPGAGRFVYDLRRRFDLYCKLCPIRVDPALASAGPFPAEHVRGVDLLIVRDNISGIYQGLAEMRRGDEGRVVEHRMVYTESQVLRIVKAGARIAQGRAGQMTVVIKDGGLDQMSRLWREVASGVSADLEVDCEFINVDHMCDRLLRFPHEHDVLVTTNLFGDILADEAALLLGSRLDVFWQLF